MKKLDAEKAERAEKATEPRLLSWSLTNHEIVGLATNWQLMTITNAKVHFSVYDSKGEFVTTSWAETNLAGYSDWNFRIRVPGVSFVQLQPDKGKHDEYYPILQWGFGSRADSMTSDDRLKIVRDAMAEMKIDLTDPRAHDRARYIAGTPFLSAHLQCLILRGRITEGMTREQAESSWGAPERKTVTRSARSTHEQWLYPGPSFLYFDEDRLTTWQISKSGGDSE